MIAAIQAGGRSARMGEDKAWMPIQGRPMIEHVLHSAQRVAEQLVIVVNSANLKLAEYEQLARRWKAKLLFDSHDYRGPLGGLETALRQYPNGESVLLLACDLPTITAEFLQWLQTIHHSENPELTVPFDEAERPQMLAAIYAAACLPQVSAMLAAEEFKMQWLQARVKTRAVRFAEYAHLTDAERLLRNVNTPADFQQIDKR